MTDNPFFKLLFSLFLITLLITPVLAEEHGTNPGSRKALLIGNSKYKVKSNVLDNPVKDLKAIKKSLKKSGFDVTFKKNLTTQKMEEAVNKFVGDLDSHDVALFFYSGHGMEIKHENYLLGTDFNAQTEVDAKYSAYNLNRLLEQLEGRKGLNIIVVDACRTNDFTKGWNRSSTSRGFVSVDAPTGTYIAFSTKPGAPALDKDPKNDSHSPFAASFLSQLQTPGVNLTEFFAQIRGDLMNRTNNEQVSWSVDMSVGSFYFVGSVNEKPPVPVKEEPLVYKVYIKEEPLVPVKEEAPSAWVVIPAGSFQMGSPNSEENRFDDEGPVHRVTIARSFLLKETEVTQGEWRVLMGNNPSYFSNCGDDCPVEEVNWWESLAYCNALSRAESLEKCYVLKGCNSNKPGTGMECESVKFVGLGCKGYRLPTEAEWEYAARAQSTGSIYSSNLDDIGWHDKNSNNTTHRVAQKLPNNWDLYDMLGNIYEWTWDWKDSYSDRSQTDPMGPKTGRRVLRGGPWFSIARVGRSACRLDGRPGHHGLDIGCRPARSLDY